mmetsp:Transcript_21253/g.51377  ORF Transcript_21253/g.51377 Transcript_21253/m.51377 type:complete len:209 (-) Transcript_21253:1750-2376(-)
MADFLLASSAKTCCLVLVRERICRLLHPLKFLELRSVVLILESHLFADGNQVPQTFHFLRVLPVYVLIQLQSPVIDPHTSIATGNHQEPLDLVRLNLSCPMEKRDGSFVHFLLYVVDSQPRDYVHINWPVPVRLQMVVEGLRLVFCLVAEICDTSEHTRICGPALGAGDQQRKPLVGLVIVAQSVVDIAELPHHLAVRVGDGMKLVKS